MTPPTSNGTPAVWRRLGLNRTVAVVLVAVACFGLGEQLWSPFMPVLLDAQVKNRARETPLGADIPWNVLWVVGAYACLRNLLEGFCYIGGGQLTARLGDRGSLLLFASLTLSGYVLFMCVAAPWAAVIAALLILGWEPLSVPVTFTTVGATVESSYRGMAFALQSIQKRLPKIIGPALAGLVLSFSERRTPDVAQGRVAGMQVLVAIAFGLGLVSLAVQIRWMPHRQAEPSTASAADVLRGLPPTLRRLLLAEILTRWCDWLVRELAVLYLLAVRGVPIRDVGWLLALQNIVALLTYLPIGRLTQTVGLQPFIGLTFVFFALFPLTLALVPDGWLALAFVVYGLREIGEPARKALITSLVPEATRARGVGLYWGVRSFAICPASVVGALLWFEYGPDVLLYVAFIMGCGGAALFYWLCRARNAAPPVTRIACESPVH